MWKGDLAWFEALLIGEELLSSEDEPYSHLVGTARLRRSGIGCQEVLGRRIGMLLLSFGFDVFEKCTGSFECLVCISHLHAHRASVQST